MRLPLRPVALEHSLPDSQAVSEREVSRRRRDAIATWPSDSCSKVARVGSGLSPAGRCSLAADQPWSGPAEQPHSLRQRGDRPDAGDREPIQVLAGGPWRPAESRHGAATRDQRGSVGELPSARRWRIRPPDPGLVNPGDDLEPSRIAGTRSGGICVQPFNQTPWPSGRETERTSTAALADARRVPHEDIQR